MQDSSQDSSQDSWPETPPPKRKAESQLAQATSKKQCTAARANVAEATHEDHASSHAKSKDTGVLQPAGLKAAVETRKMMEADCELDIPTLIEMKKLPEFWTALNEITTHLREAAWHRQIDVWPCYDDPYARLFYQELKRRNPHVYAEEDSGYMCSADCMNACSGNSDCLLYTSPSPRD